MKIFLRKNNNLQNNNLMNDYFSNCSFTYSELRNQTLLTINTYLIGSGDALFCDVHHVCLHVLIHSQWMQHVDKVVFSIAAVSGVSFFKGTTLEISNFFHFPSSCVCVHLLALSQRTVFHTMPQFSGG